jgi:hypothetical protein
MSFDTPSIALNMQNITRCITHPASIVTTSEYVEDNPDRLKRISSLAIF